MKIEAAKLESMNKKMEDTRLVMSMRFLKRLEDEGEPNLVWHQRARDLMEIFDNAA